ncbi:MAG: glycerophosphodiester phosphodiesterase family protein [Nocardioides sp.]|uniref:glycerophosphodiester phosphodiesterase n=1 Tax=Nocardioides sp. TaxID=35761 RepID=UPI0039E5CF87
MTTRGPRGPGLVIGHRGAPSRLPENTLASFRLACRLGADALETDLQVTRDGVLVLHHDLELRDGRHVDEVTLAELQRLDPPATRIPTFDELLLLLAAESRRAGRRIGLHAEVKHPAHFAAAGLPMARPVLETLRDHGLDQPGSGVWLQSFDEDFLREIRPQTELPLVQLVEPHWPVSCSSIAGYAQAIGPHRSRVLASDRFDTGLVSRAHDAGLRVFVWTLRGGEAQARRFLDAGVDGVFADDPAVALAARRVVASA